MSERSLYPDVSMKSHRGHRRTKPKSTLKSTSLRYKTSNLIADLLVSSSRNIGVYIPSDNETTAHGGIPKWIVQKN